MAASVGSVVGSAWIRSVGGIAFPTHELVSGEPPLVLAQLSRTGWLRIFFGRGRKVVLDDGRSLRIEAAGSGPFIIPMVTCDEGKLAIATPHGRRSYGVNGSDYAYNLYPATLGIRKPTWVLREHETDLATFGASAVYAAGPVPIPAVLLCFELIRYGVPGEAQMTVPEFGWR